MAYDFGALTESQRHVLGCLAMHLDGGHHRATLRSLERLGLITARKEQLGGRLPVAITRYDVPPHVHIAWCYWCSEHVDDQEL
jgi:hypothetical protein